MNRELKFRAWNIPNKTMFMDIQNGVLCQNEKGLLVLGVSFGTICKDVGSIVMQYTGKIDCRGNEIYEVDIIYNHDTRHYYEVKFIDGCWKTVSLNNTLQTNLLSYSIEDLYYSVGNIYETPELLKTTNDNNTYAKNK